MKKTILKSILGIATLLCLLLACGEATSADHQLIWTGSFLAVAAISCKGVEKFHEDDEEEQV